MKKMCLILSLAAFSTSVFNVFAGDIPPLGSQENISENIQPTSDIYNNPVTDSKRLLVVSQNIKEWELLLKAANPEVKAVSYDPKKNSLEQLLDIIKTSLNGERADSIAFANHDFGKNKFYLTASETVSLGSILNSTEQQDFWRKVGKMVKSDGRIDLLACDLANGDEGAILISSLEKLTGRNIAASTNKTGTPSTTSNPDWILETDNINIASTYFIPTELALFSTVMAAYQAKLTPDDAAAGDVFGESVSISGDYAVIGARGDDDGGSSSGSAYVFVRSGRTWSQQAKLTANDAAADDEFGCSVSISGDYAVIGAYRDDSSSGSAYVFMRSGTTWTQQAKLTADDAAEWDYFGWSVSISGDYAVIGAYRDDDVGLGSGSAYVFMRSGTTWSQQAKLTADDAEDFDRFGWSVSISGEYAVIGAAGDGGDPDNRDDYGYAYVFVRSGTTWTQQAKLTTDDDKFGSSVAISGDTAIVGAYGDDDGVHNSGSAYVFVRSETTWAQQAKLTADDAAEADWFGHSVSISGDYAVIGARYDDDGGSGSGSAYVFMRSGTTWSQQAKLTADDAAGGDEFGCSVSISGDYAVIGARYDDDGGSGSGSAYVSIVTNPEKIIAEDAAADDYFGCSVSISGDYAVIGAYGDDSYSGSAYVFMRSGTTWSQQAKLTADDASAGDGFGYSVSISGDYAVIGAYGDDSSSGSAYVFMRSGTTWTQQAKLTAGDAAADDYFGFSVAIDGDYAVIGAYGDDSSSGSAYVFMRSGTTWSQQAKLTADDAAGGDEFGYSVSISGDYAVIGAHYNDDGGSNSGSAYVYMRSGTTWTQQAKLTADDAAADDNFGTSVSISGDYAVIGAPYDDDGGSDSGSAYVFRRSGTTWTQQAKLTASDAAAGDQFAHSVSISGDYVVIGAPYNTDGGIESGSPYVFTCSGTTWTQWGKLTADDAEADDEFGCSVSISGDYAVIGAHYNDDGGSNSGSAYAMKFKCNLTYTAGAGGSVIGTSPQAVNHGSDGASVIAIPADNYHFVNWSDGLTTAVRTDTNVTSDISVTANFAMAYSLTYTAGANGSVIGTSPQTVNHGSDGASVIAIPADNYHFVNWSDGVTTAVRTDTNVTSDLSVTANFAIDTYSLTYTAGTNGSVTGTSPQTIDHGADGTEVTAVPETNYHFVNWSDGVTTAARTDTNVGSDISVTANFAIDTYSLTYTAGANGSVIGTSPQMVNHGSDGASVMAIPADNYHFVNWSDGVTTAVRTDTNITSDLSVTANFAIGDTTHAADTNSDWSIEQDEVESFITAYHNNDNSVTDDTGSITYGRITMREVMRVIYLYNNGGAYIGGQGTVDGYDIVAPPPQEAPAQAATTESDGGDGSLVVSSNADSGVGSLRDAIAIAADGETITIDNVLATITVLSEIVIDKSITIDGQGVAIVSGDNQTRIFRIQNDEMAIDVNLKNMGIVDAENNSDEFGGAVYNNGQTLTLNAVLFDGNTNTAQDGKGGAVYSSGTLNVENCVFTNNTASEEDDIYSDNEE